MTEFVKIRPAKRPDGALHRVPMPAGYGLPGFGTPLPAEGYRVPRDHFVERLLLDKDAEIVPAVAPAPAAPVQDQAAPASNAQQLADAIANSKAASAERAKDAPAIDEAAAEPEQPAHSGDAA